MFSTNFFAHFRRIDFRRRDVRDAIVIFGLATVAYIATSWTDVFDLTYEFAKQHKDWEVDDLLMVSLVMSAALLVYGFRRNHDLAREVRARRLAEREAHKLARHDSLTGLPNRRCFSERLNEVLRSSDAAGKRCAVLMLDLDGFKTVNDLHGHAAGDATLIAFAGRISAQLRPDAFLARLSGDEFALIQTDIESLEAPAALARRIVASLSEPISIEGVSISLGVGVGIAVTPEDGVEYKDIMRRADLALYRAKKNGRSNIRFFEAEMDKHVEYRARIERELRSGMATSSLTMAYQPLVHLDGDGIIGFEALARWTSPELGSIPPSLFIAVAEESGLIHELGDRLLRMACAEAVRWPAELILAFNISPLQLRDATLGLRILSILGQTGLDPSRLELEITESALVGDAEAAQKIIDDLRQVGVHIALDDFGTGYATMSQLLSLRFDKIKIDQSFVKHLCTDRQSDVIVKATIGLGKGLGLVTTAEGIENAEQLAQLRLSGCTIGQGFLFGRPIMAADLQGYIARAMPKQIPASRAI
jgi:diguanylate cyclase (GGDEF)-like protein